MPSPERIFLGVLLGTAVGDALGLPAEGLRRGRIARLFPGPWRHRFFFGYGMISDDTEHTVFIAQSLLAAADSTHQFQQHFARQLKWWLVALPAGVGFATLRAIGKLWLGFAPAESGVRSAGNGAAMRAAILGAYFPTEPERLRRFVGAATEVTHSDSRARTGALAVATLVAYVAQQTTPNCSAETAWQLLAGLEDAEKDPEWHKIIGKLRLSFEQGLSVKQVADAFNLRRGVTGYVYHTVPIAIYAWVRHWGDFRATVESVLNCGGDTDTVAAIAGALAGATDGLTGIPPEWIARIRDWPFNVTLLERLAVALAQHQQGEPHHFRIRPAWSALLGLPRNLFFLLVVLGHGLRRLLPPY